MKRRNFIKSSFAASMPFILPDILPAGLIRSPDTSRSLVLIHLSGGNDWYNTIIPYRSSDYYRRRPGLAIDEEEVIRVDPAFGFHPAMAPLSGLYEEGRILIFNDLPCSHGDNSHYTAEQMWKAPAGEEGTTWIRRLTENSGVRACTAKSLRKDSRTDFKNDLELTRKYILQSQEDTVITLKLTGFDTHQFQKHKHHLLLEEYSEGLRSFIDGLDAHGKFRDTLVLTWSEFGRSISENACKGTGHGDHNTLMIMGGRLKDHGLYHSSGLPNCRIMNIYATIIENWFHADYYKVLNNISSTMDWL